MIRIGIIGENYQNDACAFKAFLTPQYKSQIEFVPIGNSLNGKIFALKKVLATMPTIVKKEALDAVLFICDLDEEAKRVARYQWFSAIQKKVAFHSIFYLAVMELEALILSDIDKFNEIYGIKGTYTNDPKLNDDPKKELMRRTGKATQANKKYAENHASNIFQKLRFDIVYKKHKGEDSFQAFIDDFEEKFKLKPTTKERLKKGRGKG